MEQRISLVTLGVQDLARTRAFYEALGWGGAQQPDQEVVFFQAGGMIFGLWTALGGYGAPGIELAHNVRSAEEVDAMLAEAERAGATIARPAARADWVGYTGAFADPRRLRERMPKAINREDVRRLLDDGAQLVEVLPIDEYVEDHLPGAISLPLRRIDGLQLTDHRSG
jgi:uncharacterized protein